MAKLITWVDLQGRYRTSSPAYNDSNHSEKTAEELIDKCINEPVKGIKAMYGLPDDHVFYLVEDSDQEERVTELGGTDAFRYGAIMRPDLDGGSMLCRDARYGAWEMDVDGRPKINMSKARGVQMDKIRVARNKELVKEDVNMLKALENGDTDTQAIVKAKRQELRAIPQTFDLTTDTPEELKNKWPEGLPKE